MLNFGHTIGHAFEALRLNEGAPVTHGEAVSVGMVCGTFLSNLLTGLSQADLEEISSWIISNLGYFPIATNEIDEILKLMAHDKKSIAGSARFTLLVCPGKREDEH